MDSRAKQRLTGAVILVALFVLLVPELLTGPGKDAAPASAPKDDGLHSYTIDIDSPTSSVAPANTAQPAVSLPAPEPVNPMSAPATNPPANAAADPATSAPATGTAGANGATANNPVASATPPVQTVTPSATAPQAAAATPRPAPTPAQSPQPTPRPAAEPSATRPAATPPAATPKGSFVVQLGSFGSRENAERLVRDMTAKGFNAFIAPIASGGRELYRVRVGPTRDRPSAEALATQLRRIGQSGSIVPIS